MNYADFFDKICKLFDIKITQKAKLLEFKKIVEIAEFDNIIDTLVMDESRFIELCCDTFDLIPIEDAHTIERDGDDGRYDAYA